MSKTDTTDVAALSEDLRLIRAALDWVGCLDDRCADAMDAAEARARDAIERIEERFGVTSDEF